MLQPALDNLGRRTGITRGNGTSTSYAFDPVSRLSSTTQDLASTTNDQTIGSIAYNPASQIQSQVKSNDAYAWTGHYNVNRNYTVNGLNQQTAAGATTLGYDARGNLTTSGASTYTYNKLNQLTGGPGSTALTYDPAQRLDQIAGTSGTTRFAYAGSAMIQEANTSGVILRRYVPGLGMDEPVVWYEGSGTTDRRWLHADERGSVIAVSDGSGAMLNINRYDEGGIPQSTNVGRFQYTGQAWLPELGMYYYKARMYSPTLGRFMQTDPIGYGDGLNWYNYVGSDPINGSDPTGLTNIGNTCSRLGGGACAGSYSIAPSNPNRDSEGQRQTLDRFAARSGTDNDVVGTRFTFTTTWNGVSSSHSYDLYFPTFGSGGSGVSFGPGAATGSGSEPGDIVVTARRRANTANQVAPKPSTGYCKNNAWECLPTLPDPNPNWRPALPDPNPRGMTRQEFCKAVEALGFGIGGVSTAGTALKYAGKRALGEAITAGTEGIGALGWLAGAACALSQ